MGDSGVGKTCLLVRFKDGAFLAGTFISTVGIDFRVRMETDVLSSDCVQLYSMVLIHSPPSWLSIADVSIVPGDESLAIKPAASQYLKVLGKPPNCIQLQQSSTLSTG